LLGNRKIVVTRALDQGQSFAASVISSVDSLSEGDFLFEPLLRIKHYDDVELPSFDDYSCIIVTSVHGAHIVPEKGDGDAPRFYCVGMATAAALMAKGYSPAIVMQNAKDLIEAITARHAGSRERILYLRARDVSVNMKASLGLVGHKVDECEVYAAQLVEQFSKDFLLAVKSKEIAAITFFSKRTAAHFATMVDSMGISHAMIGIKALCISDAVVGCLHSVFLDNSVVADTPDMSGMVKATGHRIRSD